MADQKPYSYSALSKGDSVLSELKELHRRSKSMKQTFEPDWFLNISYFIGEQWVFWNRDRLDRPVLADHRVTLVDNRILPAVFSRVARKTKSRPIFVATPFSYDEEDMNGAEIAQRVLDNDWLQLNLSNRLMRALLWADLTGSGFWKIYWDKGKGQSVPYVFVNGEVLTDNAGRPIQQGEIDIEGVPGAELRSVAEGDVCVDVVSPFEIFPDPVAETLDDCEFIIEERVRSKEYVKAKYDFDAPEDTDVTSGIVESRLFPSLTTSSGSGSGEYRGVTVYELWAPPSSRFPQGKNCVWTKDKVLQEYDVHNSPYEGIPYVMFSAVEVPGRFWPTSVTSQLRGPQTELNKIKSQIRENANRIGNPSMLISRHSGVEYSGVPGEVIYHDATIPEGKPAYLQPPEMPVYVQQEIERIESAITEISGIHEVSKASVPSGVTAASAINLLQEADDTRLGPEITDMEMALGKAGTAILKLRAKFQDDARIIRTAGEDGEWDIREFRGAMLKKNTNIEVQAGSGFPRSKAAKQAAMAELLQLVIQYGVELNPRDLRRFFKDYEVGGLESLFATLSNDEKQIKREHNSMMNGLALDINDWDSDDIHIEAHNEFRKSSRYWRADPEVKKVVDIHVQAHEERRRIIIETQMQQQALEQQQQLRQQQQLQLEMEAASQRTNGGS